MIEDSNQGNPSQEGSSDDFFNALENDVNSAIQDEFTSDTATKATPAKSAPAKETRTQQRAEDTVDWEKRYKDSTREAQRMHTELSELKPFVPVLNAMKEDSGLVDHVRGYLENGGQPPQNVSESLGLDEDFVYDAHDAISDPASDSAKLFEHTVDKVVTGRVQSLLANQKQHDKDQRIAQQRSIEEKRFKEDNKMSEEDFSSMMDKANSHVLTLDDLHLLVNKDQIARNTADSTKQDMLTQMKNVRDIPTSASNANSAGDGSKSMDDEIFDALNGSDGGIDNLFE
jgi:Mn-dependent DtxR family transcriptional regulator